MSPRMGEGDGRSPLWRRGRSDEVDAELHHHVQERIDRLVDEGWSPEEARREAHRRFGRVPDIRRRVLSESGGGRGVGRVPTGLGGWIQDVRLALRGIRRNPGFALSLVATLALGIGATGGVFSVLDAVLLRPLPYEDPASIVELQHRIPDQDFFLSELRADQVEGWIAAADFLSDVAVWGRASMLASDGSAATRVTVMAVDAGLDDLVGIETALGRGLVPEDVLEQRRVAVMTWSHWQSLGGDPDIVGGELMLDDEQWTVVGVMARGEKYPVAGTTDLWIPIGPDRTVAGRSPSQLRVTGRIRDGLTVAEAQARADAAAARLQEGAPHEMGWGLRVEPVTSWRGNDDIRRGLWMLGAATLLMLLIALVNGTNLLLVRNQSRVGEVSVRKALGASRIRVARHVVVEAVVFSLASGVAAAVLAWLSVEGIQVLAPEELRWGMVHEFGMELRSLSMIFVLATTAGLLVGLLPGLRLARVRPGGSGATRVAGRDRAGARLRSLLVAGEIAITVVLLVGAGLFLRSYANIWNADLGVDVDRVAVLTLSMPATRYPDGPARAEFVRRLVERVSTLPGVEMAVPAVGAPPEGGGITFGTAVQAEDGDPLPGEQLIPFGAGDAGYLAALGARLVSGRALGAADVGGSNVVIDLDLARTLFGAADAAGRRFTLDAEDEEVEWLTVVGVVEELTLGGPDDRLGDGVILYPYHADSPGAFLNLVVRGDGPARALLGPVAEAVRAEDARLPIESLQTVREALGDSIQRPRFVVFLLTVLASLALVLAGVGVYGVVAYSVREQRRELGIRLALGAPRARVRSGILRWGLLTGLVGTGVGMALASQVDDFAAALLFGIAPGDPITLLAVATGMLAVTCVACLVPAWRATRVDPVEVLRAE